MIETTQDQEVINIIGQAAFGWAWAEATDDMRQAPVAILKALHDNQYVITKVELPNMTRDERYPPSTG